MDKIILTRNNDYTGKIIDLGMNPLDLINYLEALNDIKLRLPVVSLSSLTKEFTIMFPMNDSDLKDFCIEEIVQSYLPVFRKEIKKLKNKNYILLSEQIADLVGQGFIYIGYSDILKNNEYRDILADYLVNAWLEKDNKIYIQMTTKDTEKSLYEFKAVIK